MAKSAKPSQSSFAHTKETLGSIIFALIIALVFRGFVGQAFVIPTGSMAPTLSGAHVDHTCSSCGYSFTVGMDDPEHPPVRVQCPNCSQEDVLEGRPIADAGDGIFTLSWPFAVGGPLSPQRWDVVVFKAPFRILYQTMEREGDTNYIKRLIGVPGDIIEIIDGDVYLARAEEVTPEVREKLLRAPLPAPLTSQEKRDLDQKLRIARKTPAAQEALWQVLFDADYLPSKQGPKRLGPAWKPAQTDADPPAWSGSGRAFRFSQVHRQPGGTPEPQFLELVGKDFRDHYGYNTGGGVNLVSDLRLGATINWQDGDGIVQLCLSKRDDVYSVELRPGEGAGRTVLSKRSAPADQQEVGTWVFPAWKRNQPARVTFANVDHHLEVRIDDRVVWEEAFPLTAEQVKQQLREAAVPLVRIGAAGVEAEFSHLHLSRDVYYQDNAPIATFESPTRKVVNEYSEKPGWATRDNPMLLRDGEYFVLGDNSPRSLDSRRWWQTGGHLAGRPEGYRPGTVPADQMIGQAFCVYWPSWYRLLNLRVIPNIGEMRWIQ